MFKILWGKIKGNNSRCEIWKGYKLITTLQASLNHKING